MAGLLNCPVPIPSINTAQTGQSAYIANPTSVKWSVYPYETWGINIRPFREGILILPNGDSIHCMTFLSSDGGGTEDYIVSGDAQRRVSGINLISEYLPGIFLLRINSNGNLVWITENLSPNDYTSYSQLVIDDNNKIYIGTQGGSTSGGGVITTLGVDRAIISGADGDPDIEKGGLIICVDAETGIKEWEYDIGAGKADPGRWGVNTGPLIHPITGDIIVSSINLISVDSNGNLNWEIERLVFFTELGIAISPYNEYIYAINFGGRIWKNSPNYPKQYNYYNSCIYAFDVDGNEIYSYILDIYGSGGPFNNIFFCDRHAPLITPDGTVLIGSSNNIIAAFNPNLTLKWSTNIYLDYNNWGLSMISNGALSPDGSVWYCPDRYGYLYAIDVATGVVLWDVNVNILVEDNVYNEAGLTVDNAGKILYVGNGGNTSYLITINPDGTLYNIVNLNVDGYISSTPAIASDGTVYLNDNSYGYIFAIGASSIITYVNCISQSFPFVHAGDDLIAFKW